MFEKDKKEVQCLAAFSGGNIITFVVAVPDEIKDRDFTDVGVDDGGYYLTDAAGGFHRLSSKYIPPEVEEEMQSHNCMVSLLDWDLLFYAEYPVNVVKNEPARAFA